MSNDLLKDLGRSIFRKLLLIFLAACLATSGLLALFARLNYAPESSVRVLMLRNAVNYTDYLIDDMGRPFDPARAEKLAAHLNMRIIVDGPKTHWVSAGSDFNPPLPDMHEFSEDGSVKVGRDKNEFFMERRVDGTRYLFSFVGNPLSLMMSRLLVRLAAIVVLVLGLSFIAVRLVLYPLKRLLSAVTEISKGNLNYEIDGTSRGDEFGSLARSFSQMTTKIRDMIRAKEQLLLDVSHELRTPLTRMKVALEFVPNDDIRKKISDDIGELESMISELLESERLGSPHGKLNLQKVRLEDLASEAAAPFGDDAPGVKIIAGPASELNLDVQRMRIVFKNLIENALKHSQSQAKPVEISVDGGAVTVKDYGSGIPAADLPLVFEPFYRVDKSRAKQTGGYGLGLSLCKKIIEAHGGTITIESAPATGTAVTVRLPI